MAAAAVDLAFRTVIIKRVRGELSIGHPAAELGKAPGGVTHLAVTYVPDNVLADDVLLAVRSARPKADHLTYAALIGAPPGS